MTYFQAYLLTRLDNLINLMETLTILAVICIIANVIAQIGAGMALEDCYGKENREKWEKRNQKVFSYFKFTIPALILVLLLKATIPTTKEAAFIVIAPAIVNNQDVQKTIKKIPELSGLGLEYLSDILKEEIKQAKGEVASKVKEKVGE